MAYDKELKTPAEMFEFTDSNGFGSGWGKSWGLKNAKWIRKHLEADEKVYFTFVGLHRFYSMSQHKRNFMYAVTDRRILMGQVRIFNLTRFEEKPLEDLVTIAVNDSESIGVLTMVFDGDSVGVGMAQETAVKLKTAFPECFPVLQEWQRRAEAGQTVAVDVSGDAEDAGTSGDAEDAGTSGDAEE